jgi:hypothetical protein
MTRVCSSRATIRRIAPAIVTTFGASRAVPMKAGIIAA